MVICGAEGDDVMKRFQVDLFLRCSDGQEVGTHDDDGADDGDGCHASVGDGVSPVGIADALIVAVDSSLVRTEHQRQDGRGQSRCRNKRCVMSTKSSLLLKKVWS